MASGEALPFEDDAFDVALAQLVLNFMADPEAGVAEMRRVTRPGGVVGACVWDYPGEMPLLRVFWEAAAALDADGARPPTSARRCGSAGTESWESSGGGQVSPRSRRGRSWSPRSTKASTTSGSRSRWASGRRAATPRLSTTEEREALRDEYRRRLAVPDEPFRLSARAWFAIGRA